MLPVLIVGGKEQTRKDKALSISSKKTSPFDTNVLDAQEAGGIDDIRALGQKLYRRPFQGSHQAIIIFEAQNLTLEAQNAFLKNLEEAPEHSIIIVTATTTESLLTTINSRCQKMYIPTETEKIANWNFFEDFLAESTYQKFQAADKIDLEKWVSFWREILLSRLGLKPPPFPIGASVKALLRYMRLLNKLIKLQRRRVAPKLLKSILIMETPVLENPNRDND